MADREAAFTRYLNSTEAYNSKIRAEGDLPWFERDLPEGISQSEREAISLERRRALFMRRYTPANRTTTKVAHV